ncbi:Deuterolysin metalloprotease family-domain-containing protein [Aspergillus tetrazonus]
MKFIAPAALLALLQAASASPVDIKTSTTGLQVTLSQVDNTRIKAVVQNTGSQEVTFMHLNFFKDFSPVKKVSLFRDNDEVKFEGIKYRVQSSNLSDKVLTSLAPGASFEDEFDIATTADLSSGGPITIRSQGTVPLVKDRSIKGRIPYTSNELTIEVDGAAASKIATVGSKVKRTELSGCSGDRGAALETALQNAVSLANKAASAASEGGEAFTTFFKDDSSSTRETVAARLKAVAEEAGSTSGGSTTYYCTDTLGYCEQNVLAYTLPSQDLIANCDIYYSELPALTDTCYDQDQATTTLHEFTHAPGVYSPGTDDLGYGYDAATALDTDDALNNADSYALYANAVNLGC